MPLVYELTLVEQALTYVKNLIKSQEKAALEEKKEAVDLTKAKPKEAKGEVLLPKSQRNEVFYFAPTKRKGQNAKPNGDAQQAKEAGATGPKKIKHDMGTLRQFAELELDAPLTADDCPPLIGKLEEKMTQLKAEQVGEEGKGKGVAVGKEIAAVALQWIGLGV